VSVAVQQAALCVMSFVEDNNKNQLSRTVGPTYSGRRDAPFC
jgi:hypothetical protein